MWHLHSAGEVTPHQQLTVQPGREFVLTKIPSGLQPCQSRAACSQRVDQGLSSQQGLSGFEERSSGLGCRLASRVCVYVGGLERTRVCACVLACACAWRGGCRHFLIGRKEDTLLGDKCYC